MIRIEPYNWKSGSSSKLSWRTGILRSCEQQIAKFGGFDLIINWGRAKRRFTGEYFNQPEHVNTACDKLATAMALEAAGVVQPAYTTDPVLAEEWRAGGITVVERHALRGTKGAGIRIVSPHDDTSITPAPLYTRYVNKQDEFRVHVWQGEVIDVQQKRRRKSVPDAEVNWQIRNHHNGFVYTRNNVNPHPSICAAARAACSALLLDFGAVDIGWNNETQTCVVYEINTAPGLSGKSVEIYANAIIKTFPQIQTGIYAQRRADRGY